MKKHRQETEIDKIKRMIRQYETTDNVFKFEQAETYLLKVHDKYGTIDVSTIRSLIR